MFSASSAARDRNAPTNANEIRLRTSGIRQEHRPIRYQLPARLSFRQGQAHIIRHTTPANAAFSREVSENAKFRECVVVCAARYEPVSTCNSLLSGKITGNFAIFGLLEAISVRKAPVPQSLLGKFPTQINRENILKNREFKIGNREINPQNGKRSVSVHFLHACFLAVRTRSVLADKFQVEDEMASVRERYGEAFWRAHHEAWQQSALNQR